MPVHDANTNMLQNRTVSLYQSLYAFTASLLLDMPIDVKQFWIFPLA
jgi:hypothetical protein